MDYTTSEKGFWHENKKRAGFLPALFENVISGVLFY